MKFDVAYRTADGALAETTVEVADRNAVYSELRRLGITPISLSESGAKKKRAKGGGQSPAVGLAKVVVMLVLLAVAALCVWYFVLADEGTRRHVRSVLTPSSKIEMRQHGPDAPRKGTGAVSVRISELQK